MKKTIRPEKDFLDELIHFTIHEHDYKQLSKTKKAFVEEYHDLELYPNGLKKGKKFDKVKEAKRLINEYKNAIKKAGGKESNLECMILGQLLELLNRMMAIDMRKLKLEKLI
jgi:hypothetical protein